jgi:hypothetical protein
VQPAAPAQQHVELALRRLADLAELPVAQHVEAYDRVHRVLQEALAELDGS